MKKHLKKQWVSAVMVLGFTCGICFSALPESILAVKASESFGHYDENGNWIDAESENDSGLMVFSEGSSGRNSLKEMKRTGVYSVADGWSEDEYASTSEATVYKQTANLSAEVTSTISCSYLDTNYSVLEYEQLRDMLANNLLYSNVDAQISTSAVYTDAKDYLYIVIVDDTAQDYRKIYCYVVGNYRCFCSEVKEYRSEAENLSAQGLSTPKEVGQQIAESFVWN